MRRLYLIVTALILGMLSGCAGYNPVAVAETPEQKADAMYDTFLVYKQQAVNLAQKPGTPQSVINALASADRVVTPIMNSMQAAVSVVGKVRAELSAGINTQDMLDSVTLNLERWIIEAGPALQALIDAVATAQTRASLNPRQLREAVPVWRYV